MSAPDYGDKRLEVVVRDARVDDAQSLVALSRRGTDAGSGDSQAAHLMRSRLSIEPGDDYFTLVAEDRADGHVVGWCAAGGSRGQELKGWGELYSFDEVEGADDDVFSALIDVVVERLTQAQFAAVALWVPENGERSIVRAANSGFNPDGRRQALAAGERDQILLVRTLIS